MWVLHTAAESDTSDSVYKMRLEVYVQIFDDGSIPASSIYVMRFYLKRTGTATRKQHTWQVKFNVDGNNIYDVTTLLPDARATGSISSGQITMQANTWYIWGNDASLWLNNDGSKHSFNLQANCIGTTPRSCPSSGWCSAVVNVPTRPIIPGAPYNFVTSFNEVTRELSYTWSDGGATQYFSLWRNVLDKDNVAIQSGWLGGTIYNTSFPIKETLPDNAVKVTYEVIAYSSTGNYVASGEKVANIPTGSKVWIKVNGVWRKAIPWVKVNGTWKKCTKVYVKNNNTWKQVKS